MTTGGSQLHALLSSVGAARTGAADAGVSVAGDEFAAMLERARAGQLASGRIVRIADDAGVMLTEEQVARLSFAADRAEAAGAKRALVLMDGLALRLDVMAREVTARVDLSAGGVLTDIDAVLDASAPPEPAAAPVGPLATPGLNPSLLRILEQSEERAA